MYNLKLVSKMKDLKIVITLVGFLFCTSLIVETSAEIVIPAKKTKVE